jgi:hypothetical protein
VRSGCLCRTVRLWRRSRRRSLSTGKAIETCNPVTRIINNKTAIYTLVHCADTFQQCEENGIWESVIWWYNNLAKFIIDWELPNASQEERDRRFPHVIEMGQEGKDSRVFNQEDMIIIGDPDQCLEKILKYEAAGADSLICYCAFGYLSHESIMRKIELLGTSVIPELRRREIDVRGTVQSRAWHRGMLMGLVSCQDRRRAEGRGPV